MSIFYFQFCFSLFISSCNSISRQYCFTVNSRHLEIEVNFKLLIPQSKFSGNRIFTFRYQEFEIEGFGMKMVGNVSKLCSFIYKGILRCHCSR